MKSNATVKISVVVPVYNSDSSLRELSSRLHATLSSIVDSYEIILVDDGSRDNSWSIISELCSESSNVMGLRLSRNFGQHAAIRCGLESANGVWTVVMDCDLQDKPEYIKSLFEEVDKGYDYVLARRKSRRESIFRKSSSAIFYKWLSLMTGREFSEKFGNFGIYSRKVIESILRFEEKNQSFGLLVNWTGYNSGFVEVDRVQRPYGKSSYSLIRLISFAANTMISHSNRALYTVLILGLFASFLSLALAVVIVTRFLVFGIGVPGWTSLTVLVISLNSVMILSLGIVGIYVSKVYDEVKGRPKFLVTDSKNKI